jgi:hypothetical protein
LPVPASNAGAVSGDALLARLLIIADMRVEYGRDASAFSCARRNLAAATIFMAEVIFCVDLTLLIRFFKSFKLAIGQNPDY